MSIVQDDLLREYFNSQNDADQEEYFTRVFYWKIDYRGTMTLPTHLNFHPNLWKGTQKEYDEIYDKYLKGREDCFKIVDTHKFDSLDQYNKSYKNLH